MTRGRRRSRRSPVASQSSWASRVVPMTTGGVTPMASGSYTRLLGTVFIADASDPVFLAEMPASVVGRPPPASGGQSRWEVVGGRVTATRAGQPLAQQTKRHRFAMEYLKDSNGAQAAVRAGF